jgi:hypothetical protein
MLQWVRASRTANIMIAQITTVENLLHGNNVFMIPHFQRAYSWGERQWERLWSDLLALPDHAPSRMHFIGPLRAIQSALRRRKSRRLHEFRRKSFEDLVQGV